MSKTPSIVQAVNKFQIPKKLLAFPILFAFVAAIFDGLTIAMLIPVLKGAITQDFSFVHDIAVFRGLLSYCPDFVSQSDESIFVFLTALVLVFGMINQSFRYLSNVATVILVQRFITNMRKAIFTRMLSFSKLYFDQNSISNLTTLILQHTGSLASRYGSMRDAMLSVSVMTVYFSMMMWISWQLTICILFIFPLLYFAFRGLVRKIRKSSKRFVFEHKKLEKNVANILGCIGLVKSYSQEKFCEEEFSRICDETEKSNIVVGARVVMVGPLQQVLMLFILFGTVFGIAYLVKQGLLNIPEIMVYFYLLRENTTKMTVINNFRANIAAAKGEQQEIFDIFSDRGKHFVFSGSKEFESFQEQIEFRGLTFSYDKKREVLKNVKLNIQKGETVAIVGATGSGKTTLISLLLRFYDCPQDMLFIDGKDIREFTTKSINQKFALVSQEAMLFNESIRSNLCYGLNREVSEEEINFAISSAQLSEYIQGLASGLETIIGDRGVKLSGGEKQRLAIARAILKKSDILVLDEATSFLDVQTEAEVQSAIDNVVQGKTSIIIAHRLTTIKNADKIYVMDSGEVVESGSFADLISQGGKFSEYWKEHTKHPEAYSSALTVS